MSSLVVTHPAGDGDADHLLAPRDDVVLERAEGDGLFSAVDGPFRRYERRVTVLDDGTVEERIDFALAGPFWRLVFVWPYRRALARTPRPGGRGRLPWWAAPERLDPRAANVLGLLCTMALVAGYLGTVITQTITFAADEFDLTTTGQSGALAGVRAGVVVAVVVASIADRAGRRKLLVGSAAAGCLLTATGAVVPHIGGLVASQTAARGCASAVIVLVAIVSAEEMPPGSRAWAYSLTVMTGGLGAGMCLWVLPLADLGERAWRLLYLVPLLFLPLVLSVARHLPESRRFAATHAQAPVAGHGRRFWLLAASGLLLAIFAAPASQLQNEYLRDERSFSAARLSLFTIATATPGAIGIVAGGRLADVRGRRAVAAVGIVGATLFTLGQYTVSGWPMWAFSTLAAITAGLVVPALGVYRPELFPTSLRGRAGGVIEGISLAGSAAGLLLVGLLVDSTGRFGTFGSAFAVAAIAPLAVAVLILVAYPETARLSLEDLNPEDRAAGEARETR